MKKILVLLVGIFLLISCGENKESEYKSDYEEILQGVLDEHDVLMEEMKTVSGLLQKVEPEIDDSEEGEEYEVSAEKLKNANKSMFSWMKDFSEEFSDIHEKGKTFTEEEYKERIEKLKKQENTLEQLKKEFEESISSAEELLSNRK